LHRRLTHHHKLCNPFGLYRRTKTGVKAFYCRQWWRSSKTSLGHLMPTCEDSEKHFYHSTVAKGVVFQSNFIGLIALLAPYVSRSYDFDPLTN